MNLFVEEKAHGTNKNTDGFYTKTTQKGGFSKLCVKIKKKDIIPKGPDKGKIVDKLYCILLATLDLS
jgi:hypothetical protein